MRYGTCQTVPAQACAAVLLFVNVSQYKTPSVQECLAFLTRYDWRGTYIAAVSKFARRHMASLAGKNSARTLVALDVDG